MEKQITYQIATTAVEFEKGKALFREYVASLNVDLSFQNFETELETIANQYSQPSGALLLAMDGGVFVGCSGIRKLDNEIAELKRMYVKSQYRGYQIGVALLERSCEIARQLGYKKLRLDTLATMAKAQQLYATSGFYQIAPYRFNPLPGTIYMEKEL